jgi:hypothetical protein
MKRKMYASLAVTGLLLLSAWSGFAQPILITNNASAAGQASYDFGPVTVSAFFGGAAVTPNALINSANLSYIGVNSSAFPTSDGNVNAINSRSTNFAGVDQERLRLEIHSGYYLTNLTCHGRCADFRFFIQPRSGFQWWNSWNPHLFRRHTDFPDHGF